MDIQAHGTQAHGTEALRCRITGRVQGVFFRASAQRKAAALGLLGHARNCADGSVEVLAVGPPDALKALCDWLAIGPPQAVVAHVDCQSEPLPDPLPPDFRVR
jgi:acylphosphatase